MNAEMARAEDERAEREAEIAADERYANDVNAVAALLRIDLARERERHQHPARQFSALLVRVGASIRHGESGDPVLALFEDYGPGAVAVAIKRAVDEPQPEEA